MTRKTLLLFSTSLWLGVGLISACGDDETGDELRADSNGTATSNNTTATSNGTTSVSNGTSNGTTGTSNGTTGTSNGTTSTSNGTTATSNGTTGMNSLERCQAVCGTLGECPEIVEACGANTATISSFCSEQFCLSEPLQDVLLELEGVACAEAAPRVLSGLPDELAQLCSGPDLCLEVSCLDGDMCDPETGECVPIPDPCDGVECEPGEVCEDGSCVEVEGPCDGIECAPGQFCEEGECVDNPDPCDDVECPEEQICVEGACVTCEADALEDDTQENPVMLGAEDQVLDTRTICTGDDDWFSLTLAARQSAHISIQFDHSAGDLGLLLTDAEGIEIARSELFENRERVAIPTLEAETTLLFQVYGADNAENGYTLIVDIDPDGIACNTFEHCIDGFECDTDLRLCAFDCATTDECDPGEQCMDGICVFSACSDEDGNDTRDTAEAINPGTYEGLALCEAEDSDWYRVAVEEGDTLYIALTHDVLQGDLDLELYGEGDDPIEASENITGLEVVAVEDLAAGNYDVRVFSLVSQTQAEYGLNIEINPDAALCADDEDCLEGNVCLDDLRCYAAGSCLSDADCLNDDSPICAENVCAMCADDAFEPNESLDDAAPLDDDLEPSGLLNTCGGDDYYSFNVEAGSTLTIDILFDTNAGDLDMALFGPEEGAMPVARSENIVDNEHITHRVGDLAGVYVLYVFGFEGVNNDYELNVSID